MKAISWNVNGIRSVAKKGFVNYFNSVNADLFCLQEVRAELEQLPEEITEIKGYHLYWNAAKSKKGYSGTAIYAKQKPVDVKYGFGIPKFDDEGRVVLVIYKDFVVYNIYFPNGGGSDERLDYKMKFFDAYLEDAKKWVKKGYGVVCCGDYNICHKEIDIARPKTNRKKSGFLPMECAWLDNYVEQGFIDTFRFIYPNLADKYTWWSNRAGSRERNVGWRIDYFFVSENFIDKVSNPTIEADVMGSDHCPITLEIK